MEDMRRWIPVFWLCLPLALSAGPVRDGVVDLSSWTGTSAFSLDGTWSFWPRSTASAQAPVSLEVPGAWNQVLGSSAGWGTYRLTVLLSDPPPTGLALAIPLINSASEVLWNGQRVWSAGTWSASPSLHRGERRTGVVALSPGGGANVLEIRVSSRGDISAGLTDPLRLGPFAALLADRAADVNLAVFLFGCLFVMGLYHWGLFAYRPSDRTPLWFGFIAFLLGLRGLVYGSTYLADLVPSLDWETMMRLGYITFSASALFFGLFLKDLFPAVVPRWFFPAVLAGAGSYSLLVLLAPAAWYTPLLPFFQVFSALEGGMICVFLVQAVVRNERGARLFLVGFALFFATALNDILKTNITLPTPILAPFGLLVFLVFQSLVLLKKFTAAYAASETYSRSLTRINTALGRFIPGAVLGFLDKESIVDVELGDHCEKSMSVMFADIRDFTQLSESMSPEENFRFINSYLRRMGPVVRRHGGFVDKYLGDGILALFPGEPRQAVDAALALRDALDEYNGHRNKSGYPAIRMGIGIHRGPLMLGTIGENERMDSTVISDTVNAASRLEGLTKKFQKDILVSGETVEALGDEVAGYRLEFVEEETVKGRSRPLRVYALLAGAPVPV